MYGNSKRTTRMPRSPSPLAKKSMKGESMPAPAPWASAMVFDALVGPSNRRSGSAGKGTPPPGERTIPSIVRWKAERDVVDCSATLGHKLLDLGVDPDLEL